MAPFRDCRSASLRVDGQRDSVRFSQRLLKTGPGRIVDGNETFDVVHGLPFACHVHISRWRAQDHASRSR